MELTKVFEALEDALRCKDLLLDAYKKDNAKLKAEVEELLDTIATMEEARANAD